MIRGITTPPEEFYYILHLENASNISWQERFFFCCAFFFLSILSTFCGCFFQILISFQLHRYLLIPSRLQPQQIWGFRRSRIWFEASLLRAKPDSVARCFKHDSHVWKDNQNTTWTRQNPTWNFALNSYPRSRDLESPKIFLKAILLRSFQHHLSIYLSIYLPTYLL